MARYVIVRGKDGGPAKKFKQGETNTNIEVHVTSTVAIPKNCENEVWNTGAGHTDLHKTAKARNIPRNAIGYIHATDNTLYAVSRLDVKKHTLEIVAEGSVNSGVHQF
jgi:uncharacterized membrane protein